MKSILTAVILMAGPALPAMAEDRYVPVCEIKGSNGMVTMMLCPEGLDAEAYAEEGRIACDGRAPCGAWIWIDDAAIPEAAPDSHDKLPKESIREAVAIWVHDKSELMMFQKEATDQTD